MEKLIGNRISTLVQKDYTSVIIFPKRTRWKEAILFAWVIGFTVIGVIVVYLLLGGLESIDNSGLEGDPAEIIRNQKIYLVVFFGFWLYFEYKVVKGLMWVVFGKELIKITSDSLNIKNSIFSYGKSKRFFFENIRDIDMIKHERLSFGFDYENAFWRKGTNNIIFEYRGKSISFGRKLDEKDSRLLFRFIVDRMKKQAKKGN